MALTPEQELELLMLVEAEQGDSPEQPKGPTSPSDVFKSFTNEMQDTGTKMAEGIGAKAAGTPLEGVAPYAGAAVGTTAAMFPDIIGNMVGTPSARVVGPKAVSGFGRAVGKAGGKLRSMAETLTGPGKDEAILASKRAVGALEERLLSQQGAAASLPERIAARGQKLATEKLEYGKAVGKAEELGGFGMKHSPDEFKDIIKDPKALNAMAKTMRKIGDTPVEELIKGGDKMALQTARKFSQTFRELGPRLNKEITKEISANIKMGGGKSAEALSKMDATFGKSLEAWSKADQQLKRLGGEGKAQKAAMAQAMRQTKYAIKLTKQAMDDAVLAGAKRDKVRELLFKFGIGPIVGAAGAGAAWQAVH